MRPPSPAMHPGLYIFKGKSALAPGLCTRHFFILSLPPHLGSFLQLPGQLGAGSGAASKIHLRPPNVPQEPPTPTHSTRAGDPGGPAAAGVCAGPLVPVRCPGTGRLEICNNKQCWGFRRHGERGGSGFPSSLALFSPPPLFFESWITARNYFLC